MKKPFMAISFTRIRGLIRKEFILISRDKGTIAMLVIMPIMLLIVFGFAIRLDPKQLPTAIINYDNSPLVRYFIAGLQTSDYFKIIDGSNNEALAKQNLASGKISFIIHIAPHFTRHYIRGENPAILVEVDASDPGSAGSAASNIQLILDKAVQAFDQRGLLTSSLLPTRHVSLVIHRNFNESNKSQFNIVPGLIGVLLTMTMVMLTSTALTSERESGTMEMLLSTPLLPVEIILGKVAPYIILGYLQLTSVLIFGKLLIHLPMVGNLGLLYIAAAPFIVANLMVGMIFSALANKPMQAMQLSVFYQMPSMFFSGYIFSFFGMPHWARIIGYCLPMTYFMRITRGILLKGDTITSILSNILPILFIACVLVILTNKVFRRTLD